MKTVMLSLLKKLSVFLCIVFVLPAGLSAAWWSGVDRPASWHQAQWDATGILPTVDRASPASIYVMSARTGGMKGAFSMHSWLVIKAPNRPGYQRYDKVGWGRPLRENAYAADARWYSNEPIIIKAVHGDAAALIIPKVRQAIQTYPYRDNGDYRIWPGPNSNSFVAHVLREVPELDAALPSLAVGRDYLSHSQIFHIASDWRDVQLSLWGWLGLSVGVRHGLEIQVLGLVAGIDPRGPALKLPGLGRVGW